jgi:hypothetical protein
VLLPTAILKSLPAYLAYVDGIRAENSELNSLITAVWGELRDRRMVSALHARSFVDVVFTTPMVFFTHHRLVTRNMVRTTMDVAQTFIEEKPAMLSEIGLAAAPQLRIFKKHAFSGLRAKGFEGDGGGARSGLQRVLGGHRRRARNAREAPFRPGRRRLRETRGASRRPLCARRLRLWSPRTRAIPKRTAWVPPTQNRCG